MRIPAITNLLRCRIFPVLWQAMNWGIGALRVWEQQPQRFLGALPQDRPVKVGSSFGSAFFAALLLFLGMPVLVMAEEAPAIASAPAASSPVAPAPSPAATAAAEPQRFYIRNFRVLGSHGVNGAPPILTQAEIGAIVYPHMGPYRTSQDVEDARAALEKAYQDKGYQTVSVQTPEQPISQVMQRGIVVLQVQQMTIGRLRVVGSRYYLPSQIKSEAPSLAPGTVPNFNDVTKNIISLNQLPDRQVTPALRGGEMPGTVDVDLDVKDKFPMHANVEVNNRNSANTSPLRVTSSIDYDNLWQLGHTISFTYQVAPDNPSDATVYTGSYMARIPGWDWLSLLVYGLKSDSDVASIGGVNAVGRGTTIGGRSIITLPSGKGFSESVSLGLDYKSNEQDVTIASNPALDTPVTYYPLSATYSATWQGGDSSLTQLDAGATMSLRELDTSSEEAFNNDRNGSSGNFFYLRGDLSRLQPLPQDFQLYGKMQGQVSGEPLINNEQFSAGGLDTVRGYLESEALGDNGISGQFELRTPSIGQLNPAVVNDWRLYLFGDGAVLGLNEPLQEENSTFHLASIGAGTRVRLFDHFNGSVDAAMPLLTGPDTEAYTWHITFRAQATF